MPTEDSTKVKNYLKNLKAGSRINTILLARKLEVPEHVVETQLGDFFPTKFKRGKLYDLQTRRAFTYDGIKYYPKSFQYRNKQGVTQNQTFWQNPPTDKTNPGGWNVKRNLASGVVVEEFKNKEGALKFIEDNKIKYSGELGKLKRYLDEAFTKNKGKKLTFTSLNDVAIKAGLPNMSDTAVSRVVRLPEYRRKVKKFAHQLKAERPLNTTQIQSIKEQFGAERPKEGWDFQAKANPDGFKYGVPPGALQQRIKNSLLEQPWRYDFTLKAPGAWMLVQMDRAAQHENPKYESIINKKTGRVIGVKEDGVAYYANQELAPSNASKLIKNHPQHDAIEKFIDLTRRANAPLLAQKDKASRALVDLFPKGFDKRVSLNKLLAYLYKDKGLPATRAAIEGHHIKALKDMGSPTDPQNLMAARRDLNILAETVGGDIAKETPDFTRVPELEEARIKISVDDTLYGRGTRDPTKYISQQTEHAREEILRRNWKGKDWNEFGNFVRKGFDKLVADGTRGGPVCGLKSVQDVALGKAPGGFIGPDCSSQVKQVLQENPDQLIKEAAEAKVKSGESTGFRNTARQLLSKIPKGGRLGAIVAGLGAVGAGTWAMMGGAEAEETPTTEQMTYNATTGEFDNAEGDPETQEGILNWIADNPIKSGLAPIPIGIGAGLGADAMNARNVGSFFKSMKFILPPAYAAEKLHQYKRGDDMGQMFANPIDAVWAMALDTRATGMFPGNKFVGPGAKFKYYTKAAQKAAGYSGVTKAQVEAQTLGLRHLDPRKFKETGAALKRATMAPRSFGTRLVFPFAGPKPGAGSGMKVFRGALRLAPFGPLPMALLAGSMAWDKYKFNKKVGNHVDALRAKGVVSEEDAQSMNTIYKQGWLGTTAIGAKLLGSEELMLDGELADIDKQKEVLAKMKEFYEGREQKESYKRAGERQEDFFDWFSQGGRVGLAEGGNKPPFGMTRRSFLKWLIGSIATGVAAVSGKSLKQAAKTTATVAKTPAKFIGVEGMPAWFPRAVAKIKAHGKLIEMADKDYVGGDIYEMMIPVKIPKFDRVAGKELPSGFETRLEKVTLEENPLSGEISMHWTGTDNFGDDAVRQINFKPGQAGYQKFGVDPDHPTAWEYHRVKVEEPEFSYTQPDQSNPYRDDIEFLDIFEDGDEIVKGLEDMTGGKKMVTKDGTVIDVSAEGKGVDEAFQKKIYKDLEGEEAFVPDPEGQVVGPDGDYVGEKGHEIIGGDIPDWVPHETVTDKALKDKWPKKKAEGGRVGMKFGGSWADWMSNHSDDMTFEEYLQMDMDKPVHPINKNAGGIIETGEIARRPGAVPPLSGPDPQGTGIVGLFSNPKRVNIA